MSVYTMITNRIIAHLEQGTAPWRKPWRGSESAPANALTKKPYRGINAFLLNCCSTYYLPYWLTYGQAKKIGGNIRKGEKSLPVIFWTEWEKKTENNKTTKIPVIRFYNIFNVRQCANLPEFTAPVVDRHAFARIETAQAIVNDMPPNRPTIEHGHEQAAYRPGSDVVTMPDPERFEVPSEYYCTLFHELGHGTGHASRLARKTVTEPTGFGSDPYAHEELVAEMCAAFLCGHAGIEFATLANSAAYLAGWIRALRGNPRTAIIAAAQAQRAADWILQRSYEPAGAK